jgi:signal transduction histidine kinase/ActR/RegA family two-component response regulator
MNDHGPADFRALFESAPGLYLVLTPELRIVAASDAYLRATMTTRDGILGRGLFDVFPDNPDDPAADGVRNLRASLDRVLQTHAGDAMAVQKYDVRRPEGEGGEFEERYWSPFNSPVLDGEGEVAYIIHRVEDVTEFIRLKQAGREQETRALQMEAEIYQRAQQMAEANRKLTQANEALGRLYGQIETLMTRAGDELLGAAAPATPGSIAPEDMLTRIEQLIVGHKRLEEQLLQSQKMEAVGRLAGGVAHDFNNLLTVITGYAALLRESIGSGKLGEVEEIEKAALRAAAMTHKLLAFSRKQVWQPRIFSPNSVVTGMEELLRRLIGEDVLLVTILGSNLANVKADPHQLEQVIMNLAVNARDAMPGGGRLILETRNIHLDAGFQTLHPGAYVLLSVSDNGQGMDSDTAARIFEPFFTTKELGKGTGLGLSTVHGIVEQSGGLVTVESAPGAGATFRVYLPIDTSAAEDSPQTPTSVVIGRTGTVLVVEDEYSLRRLVLKILSGAGYRVIDAVNGEEALVLASRHPSIDLVLTDVVMPGVSGPELAARLRASRPELTVLYMSGYDRALIDQKTIDRNAGFLPKPFSPRALLARIAELIGGDEKRAVAG